jgi:hypothetical protein
LGRWCFDTLEKPTQETGIESGTVTIVYTYVRGAKKLDGAFYILDNLGALF